MASKQVGSAFRLGSTTKLWGFIYRLDKHNSSGIRLILRTFLYFYFLRRSMYVINFFFFFAPFCSELQLALVRGAIRFVRKEYKMWFPHAKHLSYRRKFWFYKRKPYQRRSRLIFIARTRHYQYLLRRRIKFLNQLRLVRFNYFRLTSKGHLARPQIQKKLKRWLKNICSPRIQTALTTFHSVFSKQRPKLEMKRTKKKISLMQKTLLYQNLLSRQRHINPAKKEVFYVRSRVVSHRFLRLLKLKKIKKFRSFVNLKGVNSAKLPKKISTQFQQLEEAYYRGKRKAHGSARLPYAFVAPNPKAHPRLRRPIFRTLLIKRFKRQVEKCRRKKGFFKLRTVLGRNTRKLKTLLRKIKLGGKVNTTKLKKKIKPRQRIKLPLNYNLAKKRKLLITRRNKINKRKGRVPSRAQLRWHRLQRRGFTKSLLTQRRGQRLLLRSIFYSRAYFFKTVLREWTYKRFFFNTWKRLRENTSGRIRLKSLRPQGRGSLSKVVTQNERETIRAWRWRRRRDLYNKEAVKRHTPVHGRMKYASVRMAAERAYLKRLNKIQRRNKRRGVKKRMIYRRQRWWVIGHTHPRRFFSIIQRGKRRKRQFSFKRRRRRRGFWAFRLRNLKSIRQLRRRFTRNRFVLKKRRRQGKFFNLPTKKRSWGRERLSAFTGYLTQVLPSTQKFPITKVQARKGRNATLRIGFSQRLTQMLTKKKARNWVARKFLLAAQLHQYRKYVPSVTKKFVRLIKIFSSATSKRAFRGQRLKDFDRQLSQKIAGMWDHYSVTDTPESIFSINLINIVGRKVFLVFADDLKEVFSYRYQLRLAYQNNKKWYKFKISNLIISSRISKVMRFPVWVYLSNIFDVASPAWRIFYYRVLRWCQYTTFLHKSLNRIMKKIMLVFVFSFRFQNYYRFMKLLAFLFNRHRRQQRVIRQFFRILIKKGMFRFKRLLGWQLSLAGKMNRRPRARELVWWRYRKPAFQNNTMQIIFSGRSFATDFGMYYFRMWVYYWL